jgi:hypothetical protein
MLTLVLTIIGGACLVAAIIVVAVCLWCVVAWAAKTIAGR